MRKLAAALLLSVLVSGCGKTVNASDPQSYAASITSMTKDMTPDQKAEFQSSLVAIAFNTAEPATGIWSQADPTAPIFLGAKDKIQGKTAKEIVKLGYETRISLLDQQIAADAASVQRTKAERAKYATIFDNIHLDDAHYKAERNILGKDEPELIFTVANQSKIAIKRLYMHGTLSSPGRSVPWISSDINYEFPGGLEPGETKKLDLAPNQFGDWKADESFARRPDLVLSMAVTNIEGPDGQALLHNDENSDDKAADATKLQAQRNELAGKLAKL